MTSGAVPLHGLRLPNNRIRHLVGDVTARSVAGVRALFAAARRNDHLHGRFYPPRRDEFAENAAMAREMHRL